jgi:hypothetical protein
MRETAVHDSPLPLSLQQCAQGENEKVRMCQGIHEGRNQAKMRTTRLQDELHHRESRMLLQQHFSQRHVKHIFMSAFASFETTVKCVTTIR